MNTPRTISSWHSGSIDTPVGPVSVAAGPAGVLRVILGRSPESARRIFRKELGEPAGEPDGKAAHKYVGDCLRQIAEYLDGKRRTLDVRVDLSAGTPFQTSVWHALRRIPYGKTRSYGEVADLIGRPGAARAVGQAAGANPVPLVVPCHRVIAGGGGLGGFGSGLGIKRRLLGLEGSSL